ncbi:MAG: Holliday junction resolvase RuvX [Acidobacteriota bacterium]
MSRILALDFGERRVGLALCDPEERVAFAHDTVLRQSDRQLIAVIRVAIEEEDVEEIVLGDPLLPDGTAGPMAQRVRSFGKKLQAAIELPIQLVPETLTSVEAEERLRDAGVNLRRQPHRIDSMAAQILLEEVLTERRRQRLAKNPSDPPPPAHKEDSAQKEDS